MARTLKLINGETYAIPALGKELKKGDTVEVTDDAIAEALLDDKIVDSNNNVKDYFEEVDAVAAPARARARKSAAPAEGEGEGEGK